MCSNYYTLKIKLSYFLQNPVNIVILTKTCCIKCNYLVNKYME